MIFQRSTMLTLKTSFLKSISNLLPLRATGCSAPKQETNNRDLDFLISVAQVQIIVCKPMTERFGLNTLG